MVHQTIGSAIRRPTFNCMSNLKKIAL
jgi:hypothetical protein